MWPGKKLLQTPAPIEFISNNGSLGQPRLTVLDTTQGVPSITFKPTATGQTAVFYGGVLPAPGTLQLFEANRPPPGGSGVARNSLIRVGWWRLDAAKTALGCAALQVAVTTTNDGFGSPVSTPTKFNKSHSRLFIPVLLTHLWAKHCWISSSYLSARRKSSCPSAKRWPSHCLTSTLQCAAEVCTFCMQYVPYRVDAKLSPNCGLTVKFVTT